MNMASALLPTISSTTRASVISLIYEIQKKKKQKKTPLAIIAIALCLTACASNTAQEPGFVKVENGHFVKDGKPYYYVGTNFWYGAILASEGQGGEAFLLLSASSFLRKTE